MCIRDRSKEYAVKKMRSVIEMVDVMKVSDEEGTLLTEAKSYEQAADQPVSYTHLDVYKRQDQPGKRSGASAGKRISGRTDWVCGSFSEHLSYRDSMFIVQTRIKAG